MPPESSSGSSATPSGVVTLRSTVKPFGALALIEAGGVAAFDLQRDRDRDPGQLALGRGPARPHPAGDLPAHGREPDAARLRVRGDAARSADRGPPGARRREGRSDPPHVLGLALGLAPALQAQGLGPHRLLAPDPPVAGRLPPGCRAGLRDHARAAQDGHRRLRRRDLRLPAARRGPGVRLPGRPIGRAREGSPQCGRGRPDRDPRRDAGRAGDGGRSPRPARHVADEGGAGPVDQQGRDGGPAGDRDPARDADRDHAADASGLAVKIEDGDGYDRGTWAASVEALRQTGVLDGAALRALARYHRPVTLDPHGRIGAEAVAEFELAPVGELIG